MNSHRSVCDGFNFITNFKWSRYWKKEYVWIGFCHMSHIACLMPHVACCMSHFFEYLTHRTYIEDTERAYWKGKHFCWESKQFFGDNRDGRKDFCSHTSQIQIHSHEGPNTLPSKLKDKFFHFSHTQERSEVDNCKVKTWKICQKFLEFCTAS